MDSSPVTSRYSTRQQSVLPITAYAMVSLENHHPESVKQFDQMVAERPEVLECHSMSGSNDFLLRIVAASIVDYEKFMSTHLLQLRSVRAVNTSFSAANAKTNHPITRFGK